MFGYLKNIKGKQGVTLVTLVVTIIVIMILAGVTLVITLDSDLINSAKETRVDTISEGIKDYAKGAMSAVVTDKNLTKNTIVSKFVEQVNKDNQTRSDADKHIIISVDEVNKIVKLEHREVEVEINLTELEGHVVENDSDISKTIVDRYTIKFIYKDGETSKEKNMVVLSGQTLNQYLSSTGDSIPKAGEAQWEPVVAYNSETRSNITYKEIIDTSEKARAVYDLNGGNINGETDIPTKTLTVGDLVPDPGIPTRENYTFDGWNPPLGQPIEVDTVFSAQWTPLQMTFTFKLNGGNISGSTSDVTRRGSFGTISSTPTNPTRIHYTFTGWSPSVPTTFDGNKTFIAQWAPVTYTFTYKLNGGNISGSTANTQRNGVYNSPAIKPADPVRVNYIFDGWSPTVPATFDGNKTFTAQWTPVTFTYTYKLNGGNISGNTSDVVRTGAYNTASSTPANPTRTNYTFDGWSPSVPATFNADRTFIALWTPVNYTFTYKLNGGNISGNTSDVIRSGAYDTASSKPANPTRTHYTFNGWSPAVPSVFDGNKTFTAQWTPVTYTFTFKLDGGNISGNTSDVTRSGEYNTTSSTPSNPTRSGYTFNGWSPTVPTTYDGNKTFTAQWTRIQYTFTYKLNGGNISGSTSDVTMTGDEGSASTKPANPTRTHYTFSGWSPTVPSTFDGNKTFTAQWTPVTYTFTFRLNGGNISGSTSDVTRSGAYNTTSSTPTNPTRTHYTFNGWSPAVPTTFDGNKTFTAQWTPVNYTFTFRLNGGNISGSTSDVTRSGAYGSTSSTPTNPTRTHYTFAGWSPSVPSTFDGNKTFTAQWTPVTYTFTFRLNGGNISGSTSDVTRSGAYGSTSSTPNDPTRTHYTFAGWSPAVPSTFDGNKTFTAQWTAVTYTFTFKLNGGNISGSTSDVTRSGAYGSTSSTPNDPTRTHYTFDGWTPTVPSTFDGNKTFTAQWTQNTYIITYNLNGGTYGGSTTNPTRTVTHGNMPPNLIPTKPGYEFVNWTPTLVSATSNTTYTAMWAAIMELQMIKRDSISEEILIPIIISPGESYKISNNGGPYVQYSQNMPLLTNDVLPNAPFTVKIMGRITEFSYDGQDSYKMTQLTRIISFGEMGAKKYQFAHTIEDIIHDTWPSAHKLTGPLPSPSENSFINVTSFDSMFANCRYLNTEIPTNFFASAPNATSFDCTFVRTAITSIPADLFRYNTKLQSVECIFYECGSLEGILPGSLFSNNPLLERIEFAFSYASISGIGNNLFANNPNIKSFNYLFSGSAIITIPSDLFQYHPNITSFNSTFSGCSIVEIPDNLFANNPNVTIFYLVFSWCYSLEQIPEDLFINNKEAVSFDSIFRQCLNLSSIPGGLFRENIKVTSFDGVFHGCRKLTSIPSNLFAQNIEVLKFEDTFYRCTTLQFLPSNLFANNSKVYTFEGAFGECSELMSIPSSLFANNPNVTSFKYTFYNCKGVISFPTGIFNNCLRVRNYEGTFYNCINMAGTADPIWSRANINWYGGCFSNCTKLTNYADIPATWK